MQKVLYMLGQLTDDNVEWMIDEGSRLKVKPDTTIIDEGQTSDTLYIVLDGSLGIYIDVDGKQQQIALRGPGEVLGEMSFIDDRPPAATVKAVQNSVLFTISKAKLENRLQSDRDFAARFYRGLAISLSYRLRDAMGQSSGEDEDDLDALDSNVLDSVYLAGLRFERIIRRMME